MSLVIKLGTQLEVALQPTSNSWLALARSSQDDLIIKLIMKAAGFRISLGMHYTKWNRQRLCHRKEISLPGAMPKQSLAIHAANLSSWFLVAEKVLEIRLHNLVGYAEFSLNLFSTPHRQLIDSEVG